MTTLSIAEARNGLADALNRVSYGGERVLLARRGKPVAALISMDDMALLSRIENAADVSDAVAALKEFERDPAAAVTLAEYKSRRAGKL